MIKSTENRKLSLWWILTLQKALGTVSTASKAFDAKLEKSVNTFPITVNHFWKPARSSVEFQYHRPHTGQVLPDRTANRLHQVCEDIRQLSLYPCNTQLCTCISGLCTHPIHSLVCTFFSFFHCFVTTCFVHWVGGGGEGGICFLYTGVWVSAQDTHAGTAFMQTCVFCNFITLLFRGL